MALEPAQVDGQRSVHAGGLQVLGMQVLPVAAGGAEHLHSYAMANKIVERMEANRGHAHS